MKNIEEIKLDILETERKIKERNEIPKEWRLGKEKFHPEMIKERADFFKLIERVNKIIERDKQIIDQLSPDEKLRVSDELKLMEHYHNLLFQQLIEFF